MTPNVLRNSKMISGTVNSAIHSEYSTDSIFQSQLPHSSEDDILTHGHSPKPKFIGKTHITKTFLNRMLHLLMMNLWSFSSKDFYGCLHFQVIIIYR